jgi:hypothetical protein
MSAPDPRPPEEIAQAWQRQRHEQARVGLRMTPAERLRWLEETMATLRRWCGRARQGQPLDRSETTRPEG